MKRKYHTIDKQGRVNERKLREFLVSEGQGLLPLVELIAQSALPIDELIDVLGRKSIEVVLELSARQVAGVPQQGKARAGDLVWYGRKGRGVPRRTPRPPRICWNIWSPTASIRSGGDGS